MGIKRVDGGYEVWYYSGRQTVSSLSKAKKLEDQLKADYKASQSSSSSSKKSSSGGGSSAPKVSAPAPTVSAPTPSNTPIPGVPQSVVDGVYKNAADNGWSQSQLNNGLAAAASRYGVPYTPTSSSSPTSGGSSGGGSNPNTTLDWVLTNPDGSTIPITKAQADSYNQGANTLAPGYSVAALPAGSNIPVSSINADTINSDYQSTLAGNPVSRAPQTFSPGPTTVPTSAAMVQSSISPYAAPTPISSFGNVGAPVAGTAGLESMNDYSQNFYQQQLDREMARNEETKGNFQKMLDSLTSPGEARNEAQEETGIDVSEHFAKQAAGFKEIESLTNEYNRAVEMKDLQVAKTQDKLASNNFINNQIAQIERNAAPKLNRLSADINAKAAVLQAIQGNFAEAQKYVNQAVIDATAQNKYNYDMYALAYEMNEDAFNAVESIYTNSFLSTMSIAEAAYNEQLDEKKRIGELLLNYPNAGIDIYGDSWEQALSKAGIRGGELENLALAAAQRTGSGTGVSLTADKKNYNFAVDQGYTGSFAEWLGKEGGTTVPAYGNLILDAMNNDATVSEAIIAATAIVENLGVQVDAKLVEQWQAYAETFEKVEDVPPPPQAPLAVERFEAKSNQAVLNAKVSNQFSGVNPTTQGGSSTLTIGNQYPYGGPTADQVSPLYAEAFYSALFDSK